MSAYDNCPLILVWSVVCVSLGWCLLNCPASSPLTHQKCDKRTLVSLYESALVGFEIWVLSSWKQPWGILRCSCYWNKLRQALFCRIDHGFCCFERLKLKPSKLGVMGQIFYGNIFCKVKYFLDTLLRSWAFHSRKREFESLFLNPGWKLRLTLSGYRLERDGY